jgi:hypothetical protein
MSHEIRTPLNIIVGYCDLIADHLAELGDHSQRSSLEAVARASERLTRTIDGMLDISKIESGAMTLRPVSSQIAPLVERLLHDFRIPAERKGITLSSAIETTDASVVFDKYCLNQRSQICSTTPSSSPIGVLLRCACTARPTAHSAWNCMTPGSVSARSFCRGYSLRFLRSKRVTRADSKAPDWA